jgi:protein gp37
MNKTNIEWCDFTWNPITGCKRGCTYCYANRIHDRFNKTPFSDIVFHPERLQDKMPKEPSKIFVGSMSDGQYWSDEHWNEVLAVCWNNPKHTFMFLTKDASTYKRMKSWPDNTMQGLTITKMNDASENWQVQLLAETDSIKRPYISLEPLLGPVAYRTLVRMNLVIVGAMTGPKAIKPEVEWIESIKRNVPAAKLFWKSNIKEYL